MKPPADTHVTAIAASDVYSLALTSDGSVLAWGNNNELGDGIGEGGDVPIPPIELNLPGIRVTAISAGGGGGLALTSTGTVLTWGDSPVPVNLPAGTHVTAVSAGGAQRLVLTSDGGVLAWGDNTYGELGNGTTTDSSTPVPVDLPAGTRVTAISAGSDYNLALTVRCPVSTRTR